MRARLSATRTASGGERTVARETSRARERESVRVVASRQGREVGGEFVYRLGERREQSVRGATFGVLRPVVAVRDALAIG